VPQESNLSLMPSLLVIDDHTCGSRTLVKTLRSAGYAVEVALDQEEAIDLFRLCAADAVVMDCHPEIGGKPIVPVLRRMSPETPILMVSGFCGLPCKGFRDADACIGKHSCTTGNAACHALFAKRWPPSIRSRIGLSV
jgi:response regulator RpfG family c-di-GMP phosphodiesterase